MRWPIRLLIILLVAIIVLIITIASSGTAIILLLLESALARHRQERKQWRRKHVGHTTARTFSPIARFAASIAAREPTRPI